MENYSASTTETGHRRVSPEDRSPRADELLPSSARLARQLAEVREQADEKKTLIRGFAQILQRWRCNGSWILSRKNDGQWESPICLIGSNDGEIWNLLASEIRTGIQSVIQSSSSIKIDCPQLPGQVLICAPVIIDRQVTEIICSCFPVSAKDGCTGDWISTLMVNEIAVWIMEQRSQSIGVQLKSLSDFVNFGALLNLSSNRLDASILMVNELKKLTGAAQVSLLLRETSRAAQYKLVAISDIETFDEESETTKLVQSAAHVTSTSTNPIFWSAQRETAESEPVENQLALQKYCAHIECDGCALLPLFDNESRVFGWLLAGYSAQHLENQTFVNYLEQISRLAAGQFQVVLKAQRSIAQIGRDRLRDLSKKKLVRAAAVTLVLALLALLIPWTYKIKCDCQLQLVKRRFVAAPYTGLLEKTLIENGDVVQQDQVLARMDGRQLRMELISLEADYQSEKKRRDSALARGVVAESQIAAAEMKRLESELKIKRQRLSDLEIRSPIDGVVVSGDLDKVEGAPLEMGQNLFEVGPLDRLLVEVLVPEAEIQHVAENMMVRLELSAFPFEQFSGHIKRIHPRAEVIENQSVFVAEIEIENAAANLRPGMKGRAKIIGNRHLLGWNLFHGAWEKTRSWLIW